MSDNNNETSCFWLPSEFFTDDDEKLTPNKNTTTTDSTFSFPNEFPYHLETSNANEKKNCWAVSTSPQSTLAHYRSWAGSSNCSPQGAHSPPTTTFGNQNDAVRDLIHQAANQVATLNLNDNFGHGSTKTKGYLGPHNNSPPFLHKSQFQGKMGQGCWNVQQDPTRFVVGSGSVKRKCAGTGVFLPRVNTRIIGNETSNASYLSDTTRKKPDCSFGLVPDRNANANLVFSQPQSVVSQPRFNQGYIQNYESLIARRNSIISQQRALLFAERSLMMNREMYLPQEWTY